MTNHCNSLSDDDDDVVMVFSHVLTENSSFPGISGCDEMDYA